MSRITHYPEGSGRNPWFELSKYKNYKFKNISELRDDYDLIIVGAGFGGVSAAFRAAEIKPASKIALLDALPVGYFSSGRNAGIISRIQTAKPIIGRNRFSIDDQKWLLRLNRLVFDRWDAIRKQKQLDFTWRQDGLYKAVVEKNNRQDLRELALLLDRLDVEYTLYNSKETAQRLGTDFYEESLFIDESVLINPSETIRGFASALPSNVDVFENTPVAEVHKGVRPYVVLTDGSQIKAERIILTVNAFIKDFGFSHITDPVTAIHSFGALTRPLKDEELGALKGVEPWALTGTAPSSCTLRYTPDRRIFVRTDIAFATHLNINPERLSNAIPRLRTAFERRFPALKAVPFEYEYGGLIPFTVNTLPLFGEIAENIYAGTTSDGSGILRASILGNYLVDLIYKVESAELAYIKQNYHPAYLPPEPFRTVGASAFLKYKDYQAGIER